MVTGVFLCWFLSLVLHRIVVFKDFFWSRVQSLSTQFFGFSILCTSGCFLFYQRHPLLQQNFTGVETAHLWNHFFPLLLTKTKQEKPLLSQVYFKIWPQSLQFVSRFFFFRFFGKRLQLSRDHKYEAGLDLRGTISVQKMHSFGHCSNYPFTVEHKNGYFTIKGGRVSPLGPDRKQM